MSYLKIQIGGKEREMRFTQMSVEIYSKNVNWDAVDSTSLYATFFAGLTTACYANQEQPDFTFADVIGWVDELINDEKTVELQQVNDAFAETQAFKKFLKRLEDKVKEAVEENGHIKKKKA